MKFSPLVECNDMRQSVGESPRKGCKRSVRFVAWFLPTCAVYLLWLFPSPEYNCYNNCDAGWFVTIGINLAAHGRYTVDTYPKNDYGHHATWPPVFPAVLACAIRGFGLNWYVLKLLMCLFGLANLWLLWNLMTAIPGGKVDFGLAASTVVLTALSPMYFLFSHATMTEVPFMFVTTLTLFVLARSEGLPGAATPGIAASVAFLTRGYAIVFLPAGVLHFLLGNSQEQKYPFNWVEVGL